MPFIKGMKRPPNAGRKRGSKNIKRVLKVSELLAQKSKNPAEEILYLIEYGDLRDKEKIDAWMDLLSYCQSKPKAVEISGEDEFDADDFKNISSDELLKLVKVPDGTA